MSRHQAYADGCCDSSLPDAFQPSQEEEGREDGDTYGVDQQPEYNYGGKLQKLKPLISVPQNGNLNQHEKGVDDYGGCADGQAGDTAGDIGKAGNRRSAQGGFDGKCYAEGHDSQSKAQKHTPGR